MDKIKNSPAQLVGVVHTIFPTERVAGGMFKRTFWLSEVKTNDRRYPMIWSLELWHDDAQEMLKHSVGDAVACLVEVRGKDWTPKGTIEKKVFNVLRCYEIKRLDPAQII